MNLVRLLTRTTAITAIGALAFVLRITLASSLTVDTTSDTVDGDTSSIAKLLASKGADGRISLREAITAANNSAASGPHTITLGAGTYSLKSGQLTIAAGLTINGAGVDSTTLSGSSAGRVFNITGSAGVTITGLAMTAGSISSGDGAIIYNQKGNLTIKGAALTKGYSAAYGGAITSFGGDIKISDTAFSDNSANSNGGAIDIAAGTLTLSSCKFANNWSASNGGAVQTETGAGAVTISGSSFGSNSTNGSGGAVYFRSGAALSVSGSSFSSNYSANGGAAVHAQNSAVSTTITSSSFSSNTGKEGGAVNVAAGTLSVSDSTFDGNYASGNGGAARFSVGSGKAVFSNVTVSGNNAGGSGGGLWLGGSSSTSTLTNLTLADNWASSGSGLTRGSGTVSLRNTLLSNSGSNCSGTITSLGNNLESGNTCSFTASGDIVNSSSINLAALASNGGATQTRALNVGSAAINAGTSTSAPTTDQRGFARVGATDIGAYEYGAGTYSISGTVFDDLNYGGGAGRSLLGSGGALVNGARVELYSSAGAYLSATTTSSVGTYTFAALTPGTYHVRVVAGTVLSTRSGASASLIPVLTYRTNASSGSAAAVTDNVGGTNPAAADPGNSASGTTLNTTSYVFSAGLSGTAHAIAPVVLGAASVNGIDFGFNFDTVVNLNDSGQGSLRQAITNANALGGDSSLAQSGRIAAIENLVFMIANGSSSAGLRSSLSYTSGGIATLTPASALPTIASAVVIDARTQPGWSSTPVVELNGTSAGSGSNGFTVSATGSTIAGFTINRFNANGIQILGGSGGHTVVGNWLGLNSAGNAASANGAEGLSIGVGNGNVIGGLTGSERNVMSGNGNNGLTITTGNNLIRGNYIGTNAAGTGRVANGSVGVYLGAAGNTVGGTATGAGNVISGNTWEQLQIDSAATGTTVQGNLIGPAADGSITLASGGYGVWLKSGGNTLGGTTAAAANTIAGNGSKGVVVSGSTSTGNAILGNVIRRNGDIAIDLGNDGSTANDGAKTSGQPNLLMDTPVFTTSAYAGSTLTVAGYVGNGAGSATFSAARVEVFMADTAVAGKIQAQTYLGFVTADAAGNFSGTFSVPSGITPGATQLVATATDGAGNTSELSPGALVSYPGSVTGTVFEDVHYGGGAGRNLSSSAGAAVAGARVELYDNAGAFVTATTTAGTGTYGFTNLAAGNYHVRVVSSTVQSTRSGASSAQLGVLTYRTAAPAGSAVAVVDAVGGSNPAAADVANGTTGTTLNTGTYVFSAGLSGTAHAVAPVTVGTSAVSGIDFGFNFDTIVNTNASGQGSLAQAITNANTLGNDGQLAQSGRSAGIENLVFMISNGSSAAGLRNSLNYFATSAGSYNVATIAPTAALPVVSEALVIDAQTQPGWTLNPIVELNGTAAGSGGGLKFTASGNVVRGLVINRFTGDGINLASTGNTVAGNWIGLNAAGTAASANTVWGVEVNASSNTVGGSTAAARNVISGNGERGVYVRSGSGNVIQGNYVGTNAAGTAAIGNATFGVMVHSNTSGTVIGGFGAGQGNLISGNLVGGIQLRSGSGSNIIRGNIIGLNATAASALPNGIGIQIDAAGSDNQIGGTGSSDGNIIAGNIGSGVAIWGTPASKNNAILGNRIHGNGGIGIDLGLSTGTSGDGITVNSGAKTTGEPNLRMNHPVFTGVSLSGSTLTVQGYVGSAAGQSAFANARVEVFVSDNSASHGSGQTYLGFLTTDASGNFSGSLTGISGITTGSTWITGTATDSSNNTSEFGPNVTVGRSIAGSLFEDLNYGGGAGRSKAASGGAAIANATVELIGSDGLLKASTVTAADGSYKFSGIGDGHYFVRVPIATVRSTRAGSTPSLLGVQTWRYEASWANPGAVTDEVGGMDPAASDGAAGVASYGWTACADENNTCSFSGTRLVRYGAGSSWTTRVLTGGTACTNGVFGDPLFGTYKACQILNATLHSVASASTLNGDVSGLDFGFNFDAVVNVNDSGAGSLRQVITNANTFTDDNLLAQVGRTAGLEHLVFMIPNGSAAAGLRSGLNAFSGGVATITPASALPAVSSSLVLDAQTQPGWTASPLLQINGSSSGGDCLTFSAGSSVLRGWVINRCPGAGLSISGGSAHQVQGNWIGLNSSGTAASTNGGSFANAVYIVNASGVTLGGSSAAQRNVLSGTLYAGLYIGSNTTNLTVQGNYIGTNAAGSAAVGNAVGGIRWASSISGTSGIVVAGNLISGNTGDGVRVTASGATIGGTLASAANVISGNSGRGVSVSGATSGVAVLGNSIFGNGSLGIDLGADGVTANDGAKTGGTPNLKMDFPVFTSARSRGNQLTVAGYVGSAAGQATFAGARVDVFVSDNDGSGYGEGKTWLGTLTSDGSGNFSGTVTMPVATLALGTRLTATATDGSSNTSEFGPEFSNLLVDFIVNSTLDEVDASIGDGQCLTASGVCTLRAAIAELNAWASLPVTPTIAFALPGCSAGGQAACSIAPATALPSIARAMVVDAQTQPGWTLSPIVELLGSAAPSFVSGLSVAADGSTVRGLVIGGFGQPGISIAASNITVEGNWIGLQPNGTSARANGAYSAANGGIQVTSGAGIVIGGTTAAQRNVLSGNGGAGIWADGGTITVTGNYIGTNAAGTAAVSNGRWGISLEGGSSHRIGGSAAGEGNVVSGNTGWETGGIIVRGTGVVIQGNLIGLNAAGTAAVPNGVAGSSYAAGIDARSGSGHQVGGSAAGEANVIANNIGAGVRVSSQTTRISGNSLYDNTGLGIDLNGDGVTANNGSTSGSAPNNGIDHPVITGAGVGDTQASLTVFGYVGTGTGQAAFAGSRIEFFKAATDSTGYGEGQVYLGALTADGNGRFNGTINFTAGLVAVGDAITATATDGSGNTSEFGPNWTSTTVAGLTPAGFNAFETDTAASAITGVIRSKVAGSAATLAVVALNSTGTALHAGFTGSVTLSWLDARDDSGVVSGSCRASWTALGAAGTATFANNNRVNVSLTPPASGTRSMRLKMTYTNGATVVTACSSDAFAALPATLTLGASDADAATAGSARSLDNTGASGGVVHRAGRPFTVSSQARDATGALMTGYDGTPLLAVAGCVLPAGCSAGSLSSTATAAVSGVYSNATASYAEVGAVQLQLTDASYASVDNSDTDAATRTIASGVVGVGRFVPDSLSVAVSTAGTFATANGACLAAGSGATFIGQGFGWTTAPQVTVTAKNAAGNTTTLWTGTLMKLSAAAQLPGLAVSAAGSATLSSSFGAIAVTDLGGGSARLAASSLDRFVLDLPAGTPQASVTPAWVWNLAVNDASEAAVSGNPTLSASALQGSVPFDLGATFHSGRLALAAAHGDARAGVRSLVQLQRWTSAGWVTMTEDRGCITVQPQHLGVETPSGIFSSSGDCVAPMSAAVTTAGGRAWISLPATPGAAPGRLLLRLAGDAASGHSCSGASSAPLVSLGRPWLTGGSSGAGPSALATWGAPNRDVVLRRETW